MQVNVAFRHMDVSPSVQTYASDKLQHVVSKYVTGEDVDSTVVFSVERYLHIANFTITINGMTVKSIEKTEDMYSSIDLALEKVERQLRRYKAKIRSHRPDQRKRRFTMQVLAAAPADSEAASQEPLDDIDTWVDGKPEPIKTETYTAPFMPVDQAIVQLELRGGEFFVFTHQDTERINIIYRRDDGNYGLIEAEPAHA